MIDCISEKFKIILRILRTLCKVCSQHLFAAFYGCIRCRLKCLLFFILRTLSFPFQSISKALEFKKKAFEKPINKHVSPLTKNCKNKKPYFLISIQTVLQKQAKRRKKIESTKKYFSATKKYLLIDFRAIELSNKSVKFNFNIWVAESSMLVVESGMLVVDFGELLTASKHRLTISECVRQ